MYCNCMPLYDIDSNILIVRRVVRQFVNNTDIEIQAMVLAIISNMLELCITNNKYEETQPFIVATDQIRTKPELFFIKMLSCCLLTLLNITLIKTEIIWLKLKRVCRISSYWGCPNMAKRQKKNWQNINDLQSALAEFKQITKS